MSLAESGLAPEKASELELSLYITSNEEIKRLNENFRKKEGPTDVLSFEQDPPLFGEIVISTEYIENHVKGKKDFLREFYLVYIHGILHLLGLDHEKSEKEKKTMFTLQKRILKKFLKAGLK